MTSSWRARSRRLNGAMSRARCQARAASRRARTHRPGGPGLEGLGQSSSMPRSSPTRWRCGSVMSSPFRGAVQQNRGKWCASCRRHHGQSWLTSCPQRSSSHRIPLSASRPARFLVDGSEPVGASPTPPARTRAASTLVDAATRDGRRPGLRHMPGWRSRPHRPVAPCRSTCSGRSCRRTRWPTARRRRAGGRGAQRGMRRG